MTRFALVLLLAVAAPAAAQAVEQGKNGDQTATEHRPPPGMCRIWINGVPAERQPAPTDCATAMRRRPSNARVIFGDEVRGTRVARPPAEQLVPTSQPPSQPTDPRPNDSRPNDPRPNEPRPGEPRPNEPRPNEPRPGEPQANEPRQVEPNAKEPRPPRPRVQPRPPVRVPRQPIPKPHKPGGLSMAHIRIH